MAKLEVKGVFGIDRATVELQQGKITLLAGMNGAGKSSLINAAAAVLLPRPLPPGTTKTDFGQKAVNDAHKEGWVRFESGYGTRIVNYPDCEVKTLDGSGLNVDEWSTGDVTLHSLSPVERAKHLVSLTGSSVTRERLESELKDLNISADKQKRLIEVALGNGFEFAAKMATSWATELKGEFQGSVGVRWGSVQGVTFKPAGWTDDLEKADPEALKKEVEEARAELEAAIGRSAVYRAAGDKEAIAKEVERWTQELAEHESALAKVRAQLEEATAAERAVTCSGCGLVGVIEEKRLVEKKIAPVAKSEDLPAKLRDAEALVANATVALGMAKQKFDTADGAGEPVDLAPYRSRYEQAQARLKALEIKHKGLHIHYQVMDMLKAAELLGPDGLPKRALLEGLKVVNQRLDVLCRDAEWGRVEIDRDLCFRYEGRLYHPYILSDAQRYRCDAAFRVLWAQMRKQHVVTFDRTEVLDANGLNGLLQLLATSGLSALVTFKLEDADGYTPDLEAIEIGTTYLMRDGVAERYAAKVPA